MAESAGIMSGAFFVSKGDLLKWLNEFFHAGYSKVEECASGAIHCMILDSIYPGKVKLEKVNFNAKFDYEFTSNFKVLQAVFAEQGIKKYVDVDKLVKAKYQDNLEFLQWIKNFWDSKYNGEPYDAAARKDAAMKAYAKGRKFPAAGGAAPAAAHKATPATGAAAGSKIGAVKPAPKAAPAESKRPAPAAAKPTSAKPAAASSGADEAKVAELNAKLTKLRLTIEGLEKERNFYFGKLREVEIMCQTEPEVDAATKSKVLEILYATDNEDFEAPADGAAAATEDAPAEEAPAEDYQEAAPEEENADETF